VGWWAGSRNRQTAECRKARDRNAYLLSLPVCFSRSIPARRGVAVLLGVLYMACDMPQELLSGVCNAEVCCGWGVFWPGVGRQV